MAVQQVSMARAMWYRAVAWFEALDASPFDNVGNRLTALEQEVLRLKAQLDRSPHGSD